MTAPARARQADAKRMMRAAMDLGLHPSGIEIDVNGTLRVLISNAPTPKPGGSWSDVR